MLKTNLMLSVALCAFVAAPAFAQDSSPPQASEQADDSGAGDIIVTATRRSEALSDVPLAVSAVTAASLQNSGASDIRQLNQLSPSLLVSSTSSEAGAGGARIRGIGTVGDNPGLESSVATFIDGVYRNRAGVGLTELGSIDRIEVLRGPQGTLFGRNASAGLISVITAKPSFNFGASGEFTYGNYNTYRGVGRVTGPVSEAIALSLDGVYFKRDGFLRDIVSGRRINNRDRYLIRGQALLQPNDELSVRLIADYSDRNEECCGATYLPARNVTAGTAGPGSFTSSPSSIAGIERALGGIINDNTFVRDVSITPGQGYRGDVRDYGFSGEVNYAAGNFNLTSITAYRDWRWLRGQDSDFNNLDILHRAGDGSANQSFNTFTQELRAQGTLFEDKLDVLVGGYYANEILKYNDNLTYGSDYERYANCLFLAGTVPTAIAPTPTGSCVNVPVVQGTIAALSGLPVGDPRRALIPALSGFIANPARPGFGSLAAAFGQPTLGLTNVGISDSYRQVSRNYAIFTHNVFKITDRISLTGGARYTNERKVLNASFSDTNRLCGVIAAASSALQQLPCVIPTVGATPFTPAASRRNEGEFTYTGVLSFKPVDQLLLYGSHSKGYKAGGFNLDRNGLSRSGAARTDLNGQILVNGNGPIVTSGAQAANLSQLQFAQEIVYATEIGAKYNGRGFDINVSAFYQRFRDFQLNTFNGVSFVVENINGCTADLGTAPTDTSSLNGACTGKVRSGVVSQGVEVETFINLAKNLRAAQGFTYTDTRYQKNLTGAGGRPLASAFFQLPGSRISNSAEYVLTGSLGWTPDIGSSGLKGLIYADYRYSSDINTGSDLDFEKIQDGVIVLNARVGLLGSEGRWGLEFWGQNILNTQYQQVSFDAPLQGSGETRRVQNGQTASSTQLFGAFLGEPRTYGVTARFKF